MSIDEIVKDLRTLLGLLLQVRNCKLGEECSDELVYSFISIFVRSTYTFSLRSVASSLRSSSSRIIAARDSSNPFCYRPRQNAAAHGKGDSGLAPELAGSLVL